MLLPFASLVTPILYDNSLKYIKYIQPVWQSTHTWHHFPSTIQYVWILSNGLIQKPYKKFLRCSIAEYFTSCAVFWRAHYTPKRLKEFFLTTTGRNLATWSANLPLSIRVQTTLNHCRFDKFIIQCSILFKFLVSRKNEVDTENPTG